MRESVAKAKGRRAPETSVAQKHTPDPSRSSFTERQRVLLRDLNQNGPLECELFDDFPRDWIAVRELLAIRLVRKVRDQYVLTAAGRRAASALPPPAAVIASAVYVRRKRGRPRTVAA